MISRRKKTVASVVLVSGVFFAAFQFMKYQDEYAPLQVLSNAQSEAQRLLRFLTSYQYQCNSTISASNESTWNLCIDQNIGINPDLNIPKTVYSIGPLPDYSFERFVSKYLSFRQLVFMSKPEAAAPVLLQQPNITLHHVTIVPNDPADFGRNSFDMHTINSIMSMLGHRRVDVLKLESMEDMAHSYEVLYFMVKDGILARFHQLHIVLAIDKVDEEYLYSWYKTLYTLFHSSGFRLYHTWATHPLCLQVTAMESCRYFTSWVQNPGPRTYILYPPAIDGSEMFETQRMEDFLDVPELPSEDMITVLLSASTRLQLSRPVIMSQSDNCHILSFRNSGWSSGVKEVSALHVKCTVTMLSLIKNTGSSSSFRVRSSSAEDETMSLSMVISEFLLAEQQTNIVFIDHGEAGWLLLSLLLDSGALQTVDQLVLVVPIFPSSDADRAHRGTLELRHRYSELQRITASHLTLAEATQSQGQRRSVKFLPREGPWHLTFIKKKFSMDGTLSWALKGWQ